MKEGKKLEDRVGEGRGRRKRRRRKRGGNGDSGMRTRLLKEVRAT